MNRISLIALLLSAACGPFAHSAELRVASPEIAIDLLDRQIEEARELIRVRDNIEAELSAARERLKEARAEFRRTHRIEPDFAPDELIEADGKLMSANARLREVQNISHMDKAYLAETLAKQLEQREGLEKSLAAARSVPGDSHPSILNSKTYAPKRAPAYVGGREAKAELIAPAE